MNNVQLQNMINSIEAAKEWIINFYTLIYS